MNPTIAEDCLLRAAKGPGFPPGEPAPERSPGEVYLEYSPLLRRIAIGRFGIASPDAENLVHDVFITWLANPQRVRSDVQPYLVAAICNASRHYWRDRASESRVFDHDTEVDDIRSIAAAAQEGLANNLLVAAAMARLDRRCRTVLECYYLRGDTTPSIAEELKTSNTNVNYLMHRCRRRAKEIFHALSRRTDDAPSA